MNWGIHGKVCCDDLSNLVIQPNVNKLAIVSDVSLNEKIYVKNVNQKTSNLNLRKRENLMF